MARYKAHRNLTIGEGKKDSHQFVEKGDVFECSPEYAEEHLNPLEKDEEYDAAKHKHHLCQETDEEVGTKAAKVKKAAKEEKKAAKDKAKASKSEKSEEKK